MPVKMPIIVDFPAPLCPRMAVMWPWKQSRLTPSTALADTSFCCPPGVQQQQQQQQQAAALHPPPAGARIVTFLLCSCVRLVLVEGKQF